MTSVSIFEISRTQQGVADMARRMVKPQRPWVQDVVEGKNRICKTGSIDQSIGLLGWAGSARDLQNSTQHRWKEHGSVIIGHY